MNVLILGSGGREHAFAWKISHSNLLSQLFIAPGNPGTATLGTNLAIGVTDFEGIVAAIRTHHIELVIVGPEEPLVRGIRNFIESQPDLQGIGIVGPGSDGAQISRKILCIRMAYLPRPLKHSQKKRLSRVCFI